MKRSIAAAVAAVAFAAAVPANAATILINANCTAIGQYFCTGNAPTDPVINATFGNTINASAFDDTYQFFVLNPGVGSGSLSTSFIPGIQNLTISQVFINGIDFTGQLITDAQGTSLTVNGIPISAAPTLNTIRVVGNGSGPYTGTARLVTNAVPEPATWAMMLVGFGLIGFAMRRQRQSHPKVRFAF